MKYALYTAEGILVKVGDSEHELKSEAVAGQLWSHFENSGFYVKPCEDAIPLGSLDTGLAVKSKVMDDISAERQRQFDKWGVQEHDDPTWLAILMEEVGEVSQAILQTRFGGEHAETEYTELIEVVSVGIQWLELIKKKQERL